MSEKTHNTSDEVRRLADILVETDLSELEVEKDGLRIYVSRQRQTEHTAVAVSAAAVSAPVIAALPAAAAAPVALPSNHAGAVRSPMVGTVYMSPEPGGKPFVHVGAQVSEGQTLLIVEAMKVMNPLKASRAGTITQIWVSDGSPVEFDEPLLAIE